MKFTLPVKMLAVPTLLLGSLVACASQSPQTAGTSAAASGTSVTQALDAARAALKTANDHEWVWRDTAATLKKAEEAAAAGDEAKAIKLANTAKLEADAAMNQYYLEKSKFMLEDLKAKRTRTAAQNQQVEMASAAITSAEGKKAYDLLSQP